MKPLADDNGIREDSSLERLAKLPTVFDRAHGSVTAGNASQITDGAVALIVTTREKAESLGIKPLCRIVDSAYAGLDPSRMGLGPVYSSGKLFKKLGLGMKDMDLVEINEAFAAQVLADGRELVFDWSKVNVNGGAIALGHPIGASGARIVATLLYELQRREGSYGLATLCLGGGGSVAMAFERV
jgi:acetyl-CoA C-acetyltransferase